MAVRLATALAGLLLALAAPAAALAQGAGDDQYSDPFGSGQEQEQDPSGDEGAEPAAPEPEPAQPAPAPTAPAAQTPDPQPQEQLPYTGADEGLVALAGVMMLAGGIALRVRLRTGARPTGHSVSSGVPLGTPSGRSPRACRSRRAGRA
jgi:LPXTG-motif cell wall-anchored protein